uniref:Uncharacterized protein n=1 Tax=Anguilla anguilla TaxID=7936 RepID=A0A0E9TXC6_ANGAN
MGLSVNLLPLVGPLGGAEVSRQSTVPKV